MYTEGSQVIIAYKIVSLSLKFSEDCFILTSSAALDEMQHFAYFFIWVFTICQSMHLGVTRI